MKLTALAGGVGASKLLSGMMELVAPQDLTVVVNTGDDFRWMGLYICPDLDTITYTLAGLADPTTGWGVRDETLNCLERLAQLGCATWFKVGDRDLATHIYRTDRLQKGDSLTGVTRAICRQNGIGARILPMTDSYAPTLVHTDEGTLDLQDYFVRRKCSPKVRGFAYGGKEVPTPSAHVLEAISDADAIVLCPSNPYISIGPILALPGIVPALCDSRATVLAVTPIVAGEAAKGPAAAMMRQLGKEASALGVARLYQDFLDVFVLDHRDLELRDQIASLGLRVAAVETVMDSRAAKIALAQIILEMLA
jgi:LPPG:FO 2-phospho-L-lactate transferase